MSGESSYIHLICLVVYQSHPFPLHGAQRRIVDFNPDLNLEAVGNPETLKTAK